MRVFRQQAPKSVQQMNHTTHLFTILLLILFTACQQDSKNDTQFNKGEKLRLLTYGILLDFASENAQSVIAEKWGLEFYRVGGCTFTKELVDSVRRHNKKVEVLIEKKYGKSWEVTFDKEINEELNKQKIAYSLLDKEKRITIMQTALLKEGNALQYHFKKLTNGTYIVSVTGWGQIKGIDAYVSYFRYLVDIENKQVKLTSDRVIKE